MITNRNIATAPIDGLDKGSAIDLYNLTGPAPSIDATSYISAGICLKKAVRINIAMGSVAAILIRTSPVKELFSFS